MPFTSIGPVELAGHPVNCQTCRALQTSVHNHLEKQEQQSESSQSIISTQATSATSGLTNKQITRNQSIPALVFSLWGCAQRKTRRTECNQLNSTSILGMSCCSTSPSAPVDGSIALTSIPLLSAAASLHRVQDR